MMGCLAFWEALVAAYNLEVSDELYWREFP
jgi:hypothetical protein